MQEIILYNRNFQCQNSFVSVFPQVYNNLISPFSISKKLISISNYSFTNLAKKVGNYEIGDREGGVRRKEGVEEKRKKEEEKKISKKERMNKS